ncbi:hypothetical protein [Daejeonella rubra]|nr:hypothetical protein [Daejeonella rubra]
MKIIIITCMLFILTSCGQKGGDDPGPNEQLSFVKYIKALRDTVNTSEQNKDLRSVLLDNGISSTKIYVKDSLHLKFNFWQAKVLEIIDKQATVEVNFGITLDQANRSAQKSIVLSSLMDQSDKAIIEGIKAGDQVKISGIFIEKKGFIDIDNYSDYKFSKNVFDNPEFKIKITAIEKL